MTDTSSKYEAFNTKFVDSLPHLTVNNAYLPKETTLKEGAMYRPGKVQDSFCDEYYWVNCLDVHVRR